jgi:hypothetical protein
VVELLVTTRIDGSIRVLGVWGRYGWRVGKMGCSAVQGMALRSSAQEIIN